MNSLLNEIISVTTGAGISLLTLGIGYTLSQNKARQAERRSVMLRLQAARLEVWVVQQRLRTNEILAIALERENDKCPGPYSREEYQYYRKIANEYSIQATKVMKDFHSLLVEGDEVFSDDTVSVLTSAILLLDIPTPQKLPLSINTPKKINNWIDEQTNNIQAVLNANLLCEIDRLNARIRYLAKKPIPTHDRDTRIESFVKGMISTIKSTLND